MGRDLKEIGHNIMEVPSSHLRGEPEDKYASSGQDSKL
jgi:hypothetical protein